ncbi:MAG: dihydroorotate dehydrogenase electron transfer subunit, partial [Dehalococcoidales bacterium]|nr:dihydroorotate dehydrogenase electron transfer subunit [Dehalococcoidales bacterium]
RFNYDRETKPGQFYMVWIPGIDEIPMSVSYIGKLKGITVRAVGGATKSLTSLKVGDKIGIRGPYGNGYKTPKGKILFVCGGTGAASLAPLVENVGKKRATVVIGAKTKDEVLLKKRLEKSAKVIISTDDGSCGIKGFATCAVEELLSKEKFDQIITCGPEIMMVKIFQLAEAHKIPIQASLERYMKCGIGICGQCCMDGYTVCKDGPIFTGKQLLQIKDFGKPHRDASGKRMAH